MAKRTNHKPSLQPVAGVLKRHFTGHPVAGLITASREYPIPSRVDLERAIDELLGEFPRSRQLGIHVEYSHETLALGHLLGNHHSRVVIGPLQYEDVDVGDTLPARCLRQGLWLGKDGAI